MEVVPADDFEGQPYYRQRVSDPGNEIGAFTVRIDEQFAPCLATLEWMRIGLAGKMREELPPVVADIFPYRIFPIGTFTAEWHIFGLQHEALHAFQGAQAPVRLDEAEMAERNSGEAYSSRAEAMTDDWKVELELLQNGMKASGEAEALEIARQFLAQRAQRREQAGLSDDLARYETEREWLEGLAKYVELAMWQAANRSASYQPLVIAPGIEGVNDFRGFQNNWNEQVRLLGTQSTKEGDGRFYYSGGRRPSCWTDFRRIGRCARSSRGSIWRIYWRKLCADTLF